MSMSADNAVVLACILIEIAIIGLLFYRRIWRILPIFCSYCIWDVASNVATSAIRLYSPSSYFHAYFVQTFIDSAWQFCVLVELAWSVLRPVRASLPRRALLVVGALILLAGAAIWPFSTFSALAHTASRQWVVMWQLQRTVAILRILFFLLLAAGSQLLSIGWRDRELQVATGLGFYSLANIAVSLLESHQSTAAQYIHLHEFVVLSFLCSLLYWAVSFAQKQAERREFTPQMQNFLLAVAGAARTTRIAVTDPRISQAGKHDKL
jgi:hypothetical protein